MLSLFGFGKKRRKTSRKGSKKGSRKPSKKVLKMCKKLKIKCTVKRGSKRVYKSSKVLIKEIKKKLKARRKCKGSKKSRKGRKCRKSRFGGKTSKRFSFGASCGAMGDKPMYFGAPKRSISFGGANEFGKGRKRKGTKKVSKAAAMKAFKAFYRRHCSSSVRGNRFGNGGNPRLSESMGYKFPDVLGPRSTGLFGTPNMQGQGGMMGFGYRSRMAGGGMMGGSHMMPDGSMMKGAAHMQIGARRRRPKSMMKGGMY